MAGHRDTDRCPHGETRDTVRQVADVSTPTTGAGRAIDDDRVPQAPRIRSPRARRMENSVK
jgi:hypothetical protein